MILIWFKQHELSGSPCMTPLMHISHTLWPETQQVSQLQFWDRACLYRGAALDVRFPHQANISQGLDTPAQSSNLGESPWKHWVKGFIIHLIFCLVETSTLILLFLKSKLNILCCKSFVYKCNKPGNNLDLHSIWLCWSIYSILCFYVWHHWSLLRVLFSLQTSCLCHKLIFPSVTEMESQEQNKDFRWSDSYRAAKSGHHLSFLSALCTYQELEWIYTCVESKHWQQAVKHHIFETLLRVVIKCDACLRFDIHSYTELLHINQFQA